MHKATHLGLIVGWLCDGSAIEFFTVGQIPLGSVLDQQNFTGDEPIDGVLSELDAVNLTG